MLFTDDTSAHGLHLDFHLTVLAHLGLAYSRLGPKALLVGRLIIVIHLLPGQHGQLESQREGLIGAIESSHIPAIAMTAGYDSILARITIYKTCLIPRGGHPLQEIYLVLREFGQVIGIDGYTVDACLIDDGGCHLEYI